MGEEIKNIGEKDFDSEVVKSEIPVLVDFWATWCAPCRMVAPIVEELSSEYEGKIKFAKVNVDDNQSLASKYRIMSIPTILVFKSGEPVDQIIGVQPKEQFKNMLDKALS